MVAELKMLGLALTFIGIGIGLSVTYYFLKRIYGAKKPINEIFAIYWIRGNFPEKLFYQ